MNLPSALRSGAAAHPLDPLPGSPAACDTSWTVPVTRSNAYTCICAPAAGARLAAWLVKTTVEPSVEMSCVTELPFPGVVGAPRAWLTSVIAPVSRSHR